MNCGSSHTALSRPERSLGVGHNFRGSRNSASVKAYM